MKKFSFYFKNIVKMFRTKPVVIFGMLFSIVIGTFISITLAKPFMSKENSLKFGVEAEALDYEVLREIEDRESLMIRVSINTDEAWAERGIMIVDRVSRASEDGFTQAEVESGENIIILSFENAEKFGVTVGDSVQLYGRSLRVVRISSRTSIKTDLPFDGETYRQISVRSLAKDGISRKTIRELKNLGAIEPSDVASTFGWIGVMSPFVVLVGINIFIAFLFYLRENMYRYAIVKLLGARPLSVAVLIALETVVLSLVGFLIGIGLEYVITKSIVPAFSPEIFSLDFGGYLVAFFINFALVFVMCIAKIIKTTKMQPIALLKDNGGRE